MCRVPKAAINQLNTDIGTRAKYVPAQDVTVYTTAYLYTRPTIFPVNGYLGTLGAVCPKSNLWWIVEYMPLVTSANTKPGNPGDTNVVDNAYQRWTGYAAIANTDVPVMYERIYCKGAWGAFRPKL